jgi:hypothetical protein
VAYRDAVAEDDKLRNDLSDAWEQAKAAGIDMSLLESNLRKSPLERIRAHDRALAAAIALRQAVCDQQTGKDHAAAS